MTSQATSATCPNTKFEISGEMVILTLKRDSHYSGILAAALRMLCCACTNRMHNGLHCRADGLPLLPAPCTKQCVHLFMQCPFFFVFNFHDPRAGGKETRNSSKRDSAENESRQACCGHSCIIIHTHGLTHSLPDYAYTLVPSCNALEKLSNSNLQIPCTLDFGAGETCCSVATNPHVNMPHPARHCAPHKKTSDLGQRKQFSMSADLVSHRSSF